MSRINWNIAALAYVSDSSQSYESIARKFGISKTAVKNKAAQENWQNLRLKTNTKVLLDLPERAAESITEILARHLETAKMLQRLGLEALEKHSVLDISEARRLVVTGIQIEQSVYRIDTSNIPAPNKPFEIAEKIRALPTKQREEITSKLEKRFKADYPNMTLGEAISAERKKENEAGQENV